MRISPSVPGAVLHAARRAAPLESCGVLLCRRDEIVEAVELPNVASASHHFEIAPLNLAAAERQAHAAGLALAGYFHTHPGRDVLPSEVDRAGTLWPDLPPHYHLIVSFDGPWALYDTRTTSWTTITAGPQPDPPRI